MLACTVETVEMRPRTIGAIILAAVMVTAIPAASVAVPSAVDTGDAGATVGIDQPGGPGSMDDVEVTDLKAPENATQGDAVTVEAMITNDGSEPVRGPVKYKFDGKNRDASPVQLDPNDSTEVSFDLRTNGIEPGNYTHGVFAGEVNATAEIEILEGEDNDDDDDESEELAPFQETTPLEANQTDPDDLAGKIRVESQYADNTSVELVVDNGENSTLEITVTGDAENVTFYLQRQALEASQDLDNVTAYLDGQEIEIHESAGPGNSPWFAVEIDHFSTRTLSFVSESDNDGDDGNDGDNGDDGPPAVGEGPPQDLDGDGLFEDVTGDGEFTVGDVQALFEHLDEPAVQDRADQFDFSGDNADAVTVADIQALFFELAR